MSVLRASESLRFISRTSRPCIFQSATGRNQSVSVPLCLCGATSGVRRGHGFFFPKYQSKFTNGPHHEPAAHARSGRPNVPACGRDSFSFSTDDLTGCLPRICHVFDDGRSVAAVSCGRRRAGRQFFETLLEFSLPSPSHVEWIGRHASIPFTNSPCTSVSRKSRPL